MPWPCNARSRDRAVCPTCESCGRVCLAELHHHFEALWLVQPVGNLEDLRVGCLGRHLQGCRTLNTPLHDGPSSTNSSRHLLRGDSHQNAAKSLDAGPIRLASKRCMPALNKPADYFSDKQLLIKLYLVCCSVQLLQNQPRVPPLSSTPSWAQLRVSLAAGCWPWLSSFLDDYQPLDPTCLWMVSVGCGSSAVPRRENCTAVPSGIGKKTEPSCGLSAVAMTRGL